MCADETRENIAKIAKEHCLTVRRKTTDIKSEVSEVFSL